MGKSTAAKRRMFLPYAVLCLFCGYIAWDIHIAEEDIPASCAKDILVVLSFLGAAYFVLLAILSCCRNPRKKKQRLRKHKKTSPP